METSLSVTSNHPKWERSTRGFPFWIYPSLKVYIFRNTFPEVTQNVTRGSLTLDLALGGCECIHLFIMDY